MKLKHLYTGLLCNRDHKIWDYRSQPFQYKGQICLLFSLFWMPASLLAMKLYALAEKLFPINDGTAAYR